MPEQQNFSNHTKFFPPFHFFLLPIFMANLIWSLFRVSHDGFTPYSIFQVFVAAALFLTPAVARLMALKVQDRVIRLEERLRYQLFVFVGGLQPALFALNTKPRTQNAHHRITHHGNLEEECKLASSEIRI